MFSVVPMMMYFWSEADTDNNQAGYFDILDDLLQPFDPLSGVENSEDDHLHELIF